MADERHESRPKRGKPAREAVPPPRRLDDAARSSRQGRVGPAPWSGRASVPPPGERGVRGLPPGAWGTDEYPDGDEEQQYGRWWTPIPIGAVALALLGILAYAGWLLLGSNWSGPVQMVPPPSPSAAPAATSGPDDTTPDTADPGPTVTTAEGVELPSLVGLPEATARTKLDELGLSYRLEFRETPDPIDTVIETDPAAGTVVTPDDLITLVVAERGSNAPTTGAPSGVSIQPTASG